MTKSDEPRDHRRLSGAEARALCEALLHVFPSRDQLTAFVRFELDLNLNEVVPESANLREGVLALVEHAQSHGVLLQLARRAHATTHDPRFAEVLLDVESAAGRRPRIHVRNMPTTDPLVLGRERVLSYLTDTAIHARANVVVLTALGGVGKTSILNRWLQDIAEGGEPFGRLNTVYAWSFYKPGAATVVTSAADFIDDALRTLAGPGQLTASRRETVREKAHRLVDVIRARPCVLILDGLEPLINPPQGGAASGYLRDGDFADVLKNLALQNPGLCVITSRWWPRDLDTYRDRGVRETRLKELDPDSGVSLLRELGVRGRTNALSDLVRAYQGHALSLTLVGTYLREVYRGDVVRLDHRTLLPPRRGEVGQRIRHVLDRYLVWLRGSDAIVALRLLSAFDRPTSVDTMLAVLRGMPDEGVAGDGLRRMEEEAFLTALARLRELRLVNEEDGDDPSRVDTHPLIRECVRERVVVEDEGRWRELNRVIFDVLCAPVVEPPDEIEGLSSLYQAIIHGCRARAYDDTYRVLQAKIWRDWLFYGTRTVGAIALELSVVAHFFAGDFGKLLVDDPAGRVALPGSTSYLLWVTGRLRDAARVANDRMKVFRVARDSANFMGVPPEWELAITAGSLSVVHGLIADLDAALAFSEETVEVADGALKGPYKAAARKSKAWVLHLRGDAAQVESLCGVIERLEQTEEGSLDNDLVDAVAELIYCEVLVGRGAFEEARARARRLGDRSSLPLERGVSQLILADANWRDAQPAAAEGLLPVADEALRSLRVAGHDWLMPRAYLVRARVHLRLGSFENAQQDIEVATEAAAESGAVLYQIDARLAGIALMEARGLQAEARAARVEVAAVAERHGYAGRLRELGDGGVTR